MEISTLLHISFVVLQNSWEWKSCQTVLCLSQTLSARCLHWDYLPAGGISAPFLQHTLTVDECFSQCWSKNLDWLFCVSHKVYPEPVSTDNLPAVGQINSSHSTICLLQ